MTRLEKMLKRGAYVAASALAFVLLVLSLAATAVAIKLDGKGPIFFRQERVGMGGRRLRG